jgi:hypothetical protein
VACGTGEACVSGACTMVAADAGGPRVDAGTGGCVDGDGGLHRGTTTQNCGSAGAQCVACAMGQACVSGACM